ncbi:hypothetical protein ACEWPL_006595 [Roseovarius sp. S1116L3]|uniref:hypothetical protein n=1 Tax=Roseovarius roseus TaxID=3342636 RepID=UPI003728774D
MMPLVQVIWLSLSAGIFSIWACMLCAFLPALRRSTSDVGVPSGPRLLKLACSSPMSAQILGRLAALTAVLLMLIGLGLLIWPP